MGLDWVGLDGGLNQEGLDREARPEGSKGGSRGREAGVRKDVSSLKREEKEIKIRRTLKAESAKCKSISDTDL